MEDVHAVPLARVDAAAGVKVVDAVSARRHAALAHVGHVVDLVEAVVGEDRESASGRTVASLCQHRGRHRAGAAECDDLARNCPAQVRTHRVRQHVRLGQEGGAIGDGAAGHRVGVHITPGQVDLRGLYAEDPFGHGHRNPVAVVGTDAVCHRSLQVGPAELVVPAHPELGQQGLDTRVQTIARVDPQDRPIRDRTSRDGVGRSLPVGHEAVGEVGVAGAVGEGVTGHGR